MCDGNYSMMRALPPYVLRASCENRQDARACAFVATATSLTMNVFFAIATHTKNHTYTCVICALICPAHRLLASATCVFSVLVESHTHTCFVRLTRIEVCACVDITQANILSTTQVTYCIVWCICNIFALAQHPKPYLYILYSICIHIWWASSARVCTCILYAYVVQCVKTLYAMLKMSYMMWGSRMIRAVAHTVVGVNKCLNRSKRMWHT